ncbi:MAG: hypothetical protein WBJ58_02765, partial [Syntrophales bacterium]
LVPLLVSLFSKPEGAPPFVPPWSSFSLLTPEMRKPFPFHRFNPPVFCGMVAAAGVMGPAREMNHG